MELNGTIVVQAINFFIVYLVLKKFLFRPAVDAIMHDRHYEQTLRKAIIHHNKAIEQKEEKQRDCWRACQQFFVSQAPELKPQRRFVAEQTVPEQELVVSEELRAKVVSQTEQQLVEKVNHVRV